MMAGLSRSAAACSAATSATARKALSVLRKPICARLSSCSIKLEVVGGLEREERGHPHHHRAQGFVAEVEVVVREAAALAGENPVIWILGGIFGGADAKARPLLHALEDEVHAVGVVPGHAALPGQDMVFLAHALLGPFDRQPMIAGEGFHPVLVVGRAPTQHLFVHHRNANHLTEEVNHLLGPRQPAEVTVNDDAVEAVVDEGQQIAEQLGEQFHGNPLQARKPVRRGTGKRIVEGKSFRLADEVRYIQGRATDHHGRFVTIGQLVLFSTETGDAWLLNPADRLAARLARDGESEPVHIEETDTTFAIGWKGRYRIDGPAFVYSDRDTGRVTTILGYPTERLIQTE